MSNFFRVVARTAIVAVLISAFVFNTTAFAAANNSKTSQKAVLTNSKILSKKESKAAEKEAKKLEKQHPKIASEDVMPEISLQMMDGDKWVNAEGKTLRFYSEESENDQEILWEPGSEYKLPMLRLCNKTEADIEYTVEITGIKGDAKLNEVIHWNYVSCDSVVDLGDITGVIKAGETSDSFTISGHMSETASNAYQGLCIEGISINVKITDYEEAISGPYYTINTDTDLVIDEQGKHIVFNDEEQNYLASVDGQKITLSNATYSGKTVALLFGQYRTSSYCNFNNEVNNINVLGLNVCNAIYNGTDKLSIAVYTYGNTVLNNCVMKGTTSTAEGFEVYDLGSVNRSVTDINGGEYGSIYVWSQAHVTINDAEVDKIVSAAITTRNLGMLTIGNGTHVGTIDLTVGGWTQYKPALTIEEGAVVDNIIYNGVTYTQDEWMNNKF